MKRLIIATLLGLVFGFVCLSLAKSGVYEISTALAVSIVSGRVLIGFAIGISKFSFKHKMLFLSTVITGMIYGFLIELITSAIFKAKQ